jgi:hypothetical protein
LATDPVVGPAPSIRRMDDEPMNDIPVPMRKPPRCICGAASTCDAAWCPQQIEVREEGTRKALSEAAESLLRARCDAEQP